MFQIKICGITTVADAQVVAESGADAAGLNFYAKSPRYVRPEDVEAVTDALGPKVKKVGLFVNAPAEEIRRTAERLSFDLIQLHGDEPPELIAELKPLPVMKAFRIGTEGLTPILDYLDRCRELEAVPRMVLLDAMVKGAYGGTGMKADWAACAAYAVSSSNAKANAATPSLVLAGGLTPENVAEAIAAVRPCAVDTASGVEMSPGKKDAEAVRQFVSAARQAFERQA